MEAKLSVSLNDLIRSGILSVPLQLYGELNGHHFEATLSTDGSIAANGKIFNSLSVAAGSLITVKTGKISSKRTYYACNGWKFWHIKNAKGDFIPLDSFRDRVSG